VFTNVRLRGGAGSILWGARTAAVISGWSIAKGDDGRWMLTAAVQRIDAFQCRQKPLLFAAPREHAGFWCWPVLGELRVGTNRVVAMLGPPEQ
jgi:hypothetical protein